MMVTTVEIASSIQNVGQRLKQQMAAFGWGIDTPLSQFVGGYTISAAPATVAEYAELVASRVSRVSKQQLEMDGFGVWLAKLPAQLDLLQFNGINQNPSPQLTNAMMMLQMIDTAIPSLPPREPKVNWEDIKNEKTLLPRDLKTRLRSVEARLADLEPRSNEIAAKIADIENAHAAADQLPTDLAELAEKKAELEGLVLEAQGVSAKISKLGSESENIFLSMTELSKTSEEKIKITGEATDGIVARCEQALRGATSVGLSKSFSSRKDALAKTSGWWTIGLIISLIVAVVIGWERVSSLRDILSGSKSATVILVNMVLAGLGVGAPVWFAWLATKQIGTTFRLSEDYAFKASVAQAYEGYRAEAVTIDENLRSRLFSSALDRFEEAPIRLIDPAYHSSPLQELLNNPAFRKSLEGIPNIAEKIVALVPGKMLGAAAIAGSAATATATVPALVADLKEDDA